MSLDDRVTITTPEGVQVELLVAGVGSRFLARLLDTLIQVGVLWAVSMGIGIVTIVSPDPIAIVLIILVYFAVFFVYDPLFELVNHGQTPGKRSVGLRVVDREGRPVGFWSSITRNVVRIADALPMFYCIGFVTMIATRHAQRLGDLAGGTYVIRERTTALRAIRSAQTTVIPEAVRGWDVSTLNSAELDAIRAFLARRTELPSDVRWRISVDLATRVAERVSGLPERAHPEYVLEGVIVAKAMRSR